MLAQLFRKVHFCNYVLLIVEYYNYEYNIQGGSTAATQTSSELYWLYKSCECTYLALLYIYIIYMKYKFKRDLEITHSSPSQVLTADLGAHIYMCFACYSM